VLFVAPHPHETRAAEWAAAGAGRTLTLCRELTKQFETVATMPAGELPGGLAADSQRRRGEFVLVLHAQAAAVAEDDTARALPLLRRLLDELPLKQAVRLASELSGAPRNALYDEALRLKGSADA
jgi:16S rRNA (cytidine1402-2'-O)-methyltransferase